MSLSTKENDKAQSRNIMYVQQIEHLGMEFKDIQKVLEDLEQKGTLKKWAMILHDKDETKPHIHVFMQFKNGRTFNGVAQLFEESNPNRMRKWDKKVGNAYSYLLHLSDSAKEGKHIYSPDEVIANFDFKAQIEKITKEVENAKKKQLKLETRANIEIVLHEYKEGTITKQAVEDMIGGGKYGKYAKEIREIETYLKKKKIKEYREGLSNGIISRKNIWLMGTSGCGKTLYAQKLAEEQGKTYFVSGSRRDPLQGYDFQDVCVLDEIREKTFKYDELLKILDPHNSTGVSSRYQDKFICGDVYITSYMSPREYYDRLMGYDKAVSPFVDYARQENKDSFLQLARRIFMVREFTQQHIKTYIFDQETLRFEEQKELQEPNPYYKGITFASKAEVKAFLNSTKKGSAKDE